VGNRLPDTEGTLEGYFAGEFAHSLDEKGRLAVPAKFRARFKEGAVVTRWTNECLAVFPTSEWEAINAEIRKRPRTDRTVQTFVHFLVGGAHEADLDAQGRISIPAHLRQYAGLTGDAPNSSSRGHCTRTVRPGWRMAMTEASKAASSAVLWP